jgi:hypothetical protein
MIVSEKKNNIAESHEGSDEVNARNSQQNTSNTRNNCITDNRSEISKQNEMYKRANETARPSLMKYILEQRKIRKKNPPTTSISICFAEIAVTPST